MYAMEEFLQAEVFLDNQCDGIGFFPSFPKTLFVFFRCDLELTFLVQEAESRCESSFKWQDSVQRMSRIEFLLRFPRDKMAFPPVGRWGDTSEVVESIYWCRLYTTRHLSACFVEGNFNCFWVCNVQPHRTVIFCYRVAHRQSSCTHHMRACTPRGIRELG